MGLLKPLHPRQSSLLWIMIVHDQLFMIKGAKQASRKDLMLAKGGPAGRQLGCLTIDDTADIPRDAFLAYKVVESALHRLNTSTTKTTAWSDLKNHFFLSWMQF